MPKLAGEHYFTVVGHHGYGDGLLAKTEHGFVAAARSLMIGNRHEEILHPPVKIRIVSPTVSLMERLHVLRHDRIVQLHREWLSYRFKNYLELFDKIPPGWVASEEPCEDTRTDFVECWVENTLRCFVWGGEGHIRELFPHDYHCDDDEGEDSIAPEGDDSLKFSVAYRGHRGGMGDQFSAFGFEESPPIGQTPAFFFQKIADLTCLQPIQEEIAETRRLEKIRREESNQRADEAMSEYDREENEKVRVLFERHFEMGDVR